ncbi:MAG: HAD hydrolase-like protein [Clostridia bacterium]|nr:HAD hydrolase-like protein [Clostridia bacterium]
MLKFDAVLFDFDGTIADTSPGIKEGLRHTFELNNMPIMSDNEMDRFIGPPLDDSFVKYCNVERKKAKEMVLQFREHYHTKAIDKFVIYDGLEKALDVLREKGILTCVATSKPEPMAVHILKKAGIFHKFDIIQGATLDGKLIKKTDIVHHVLSREILKDKNPLMVGDTEFDIYGAHQNNLPCLWVEYGFGTYDAALAENPEFIVSNTEKMIEFFKNF